MQWVIRQVSKLSFFVFLSVALHLALLVVGMGSMVHFPVAKNDPLEIVSEESLSPPGPPAADRNLVVDTEVAGEPTKPTGPSRLGKNDQKVEKETRSAGLGQFKEGGTGTADHLSLSDLGIGSSWRERAGSTDDNLEGVAPSARTILNTRKNRYFSFYARVKDELRLHWKPEVEERALKLAQRGIWPERKKLVTKVVVLIDSDGKIVKISTAESSGFSEIDGAADYAFEKVGRFPNLPKAMIDSDGYARLYWDFILLANGSQAVRMADNSPPAVNRID